MSAKWGRWVKHPTILFIGTSTLQKKTQSYKILNHKMSRCCTAQWLCPHTPMAASTMDPNHGAADPYESNVGGQLLANHNWSLHPTHHFYGHSYLAPTPSITTVQSLGVSLTKAFAHHTG
jgi:hypothetical protein